MIRQLTVVRWKYWILIALIVVAAVLRVMETYEIAAELGVDLSSYSSAAREVRRATAAFRTSDALRLDVGFSFLERQLEKAVMAIGFVCSYLTVHHLVFGRNKRDAAYSLFTLLLCVAFAFLRGGRSVVMFYFLAVMASLFVLLLKKGVDSRKLSRYTLLACIVAAFIGSAVFYFSSALVGRKAGEGIVEYISFYFGCGIPSFQSLVDSGYSASTNGVMSFYNLLTPLVKFGVVDDMPSYSLAWVNLEGFKSNVFSGFARYYFEFGYIGVAALSFFAGVISNAIYRFAKRRLSPASIVVASYIAAHTFDAAREEFVFSRLLSLNQLATVLLLAIFAYFLTASFREGACKLKANFKRKLIQ